MLSEILLGFLPPNRTQPTVKEWTGQRSDIRFFNGLRSKEVVLILSLPYRSLVLDSDGRRWNDLW